MDMNGIEIRHVGPGDAALFDRVADEVFDAPVRPDRIAAYLAEPGHLMVLALEKGVVVGQCAAVIHRHPDKVDELYIDNVGVTPALHRQGIATAMLDAMWALGRARGCGEAWVGTEPNNVAAKALYRSRDAEPIPVVMYEWEF